MTIGVPKHHLHLTEKERKILSRIDLRIELPNNVDGHEVYLANCEPIMALLKSLSARSGIPERRLAYWTDPKFKPGRTKGSLRDLFARNGSSGREAYTHPHFLPVLRFFLFGADLPPASIEAFEAQVGNPKWFSGSDILGLTKKTRAIVRDFNLRHHDDEFFKLAIDNGLNHSNAESVRKAAVEASRR
ncbi:hypothetical protein [Agrobacterium pusense]|uniref:hypothetical protein n=1 Tax=Agrobacterium pusense TaxID=648995 RepID=UPI000D1BE94F|nr:hypothetical protein [Agrobacterium pusense]